jgi:hypothetical protein
MLFSGGLVRRKVFPALHFRQSYGLSAPDASGSPEIKGLASATPLRQQSYGLLAVKIWFKAQTSSGAVSIRGVNSDAVSRAFSTLRRTLSARNRTSSAKRSRSKPASRKRRVSIRVSNPRKLKAETVVLQSASVLPSRFASWRILPS